MKESVFNNKLNSKNGASILVALFVLLVCTIISSIVVTAGFASAGRIVGVAQSDQRYYTVTSAANIIKEAIEDSEVVFVRKVDGSDYKFSFGESYDSGRPLKKGGILLDNIALDYCFSVVDDMVEENASNYEVNVNELSSVNEYETTIDVDASNAELVNVKADIKLTADKFLILEIHDGDGGVGHYNMRYTYSSNVQEYEDINENENTRTKLTRLSWILQKVEKI